MRLDLPLRVTPAQRALLVTAALGLAVQSLPVVGLHALRQPLALALAAAWVVVAFVTAGRILRRRRNPTEGPIISSGAPGDAAAQAAADAPEPRRMQ